jgi:hypothetical protein
MLKVCFCTKQVDGQSSDFDVKKTLHKTSLLHSMRCNKLLCSCYNTAYYADALSKVKLLLFLQGLHFLLLLSVDFESEMAGAKYRLIFEIERTVWKFSIFNEI